MLYLSEDDSERAVDIIRGPLLDYIVGLGYNIQSDVQFLAPMIRGHCGTNNICNQVQSVVHTRKEGGKKIKKSSTSKSKPTAAVTNTFPCRGSCHARFE